MPKCKAAVFPFVGAENSGLNVFRLSGQWQIAALTLSIDGKRGGGPWRIVRLNPPTLLAARDRHGFNFSNRQRCSVCRFDTGQDYTVRSENGRKIHSKASNV